MNHHLRSEKSSDADGNDKYIKEAKRIRKQYRERVAAVNAVYLKTEEQERQRMQKVLAENSVQNGGGARRPPADYQPGRRGPQRRTRAGPRNGHAAQYSQQG